MGSTCTGTFTFYLYLHLHLHQGVEEEAEEPIFNLDEVFGWEKVLVTSGDLK